MHLVLRKPFLPSVLLQQKINRVKYVARLSQFTKFLRAPFLVGVVLVSSGIRLFDYKSHRYTLNLSKISEPETLHNSKSSR